MKLAELLKIVDNKNIEIYNSWPITKSYKELYWKVEYLGYDGEFVLAPYFEENAYDAFVPTKDKDLSVDTDAEVRKVTTITVSDEGSEPTSVLAIII